MSSIFKKKYDSDPDFRNKHLAYLQQHVECPGCGRSIQRCNMTRHKQTAIHKKNALKKFNDNIDKKDEIEKKFDEIIKIINQQKLLELEKINSTHNPKN